MTPVNCVIQHGESEDERRGRALFATRLLGALRRGKHNGRFATDEEKQCADAMIELHDALAHIKELEIEANRNLKLYCDRMADRDEEITTMKSIIERYVTPAGYCKPCAGTGDSVKGEPCPYCKGVGMISLSNLRCFVAANAKFCGRLQC